MTPRLVLCLMACAFHWLPVALAEQVHGARFHLGWVGCVAYSLLWVVLAVLCLYPAPPRR